MFPCMAFCQYQMVNHWGIIRKMIFKLAGTIGIPSDLQEINPSLILCTIVLILLLFLPNCALSPFSLIMDAAIHATNTACIFSQAFILPLTDTLNPALSKSIFIWRMQTEFSPFI